MLLFLIEASQRREDSENGITQVREQYKLKKGFAWTDSGMGLSATLSHVLSAGDRTSGGEYASRFQLRAVVEVCMPVTPAKCIIMKTTSLLVCH